MSTITLVIIPGPGAQIVEISENTTVQNLIDQNNISGRDIIVDGVGIQPNEYATTVLAENAEVFATGSVKGNS